MPRFKKCIHEKSVSVKYLKTDYSIKYNPFHLEIEKNILLLKCLTFVLHLDVLTRFFDIGYSTCS